MDLYHNTNGSELQMRITTNGSSYPSSGYVQIRSRWYSSSSTTDISTKSDTIWSWSFGGGVGATNTRSSADIWLGKPTLNAYPDARGFFWGAESNQALWGTARGRYETAGAFTGFQFTQSDGSNFTGKFVLYGIKD